MTHHNILEYLNRGHPFRWLLVYVSVVWVALQVADIITESFGGAAHLMQILILIAAGGVPLVIVVSLYFSTRENNCDLKEETSEPVADTDTLTGTLSLAISPFQCLSEFEQDELYCNVLTEDLIALISRNSRYRVSVRCPAASPARIKRGRTEAAGLQEERYVLEGSLRRSAAGIHVTAHLMDMLSGAYLWSEKYERNADEFESVIETLCEAIAIQLDTEFTRAEIDSAELRPLSQNGTWALYQQARGKLQFSGWSIQTFNDTETLLRQALVLDPNFAPAHAYLALILALSHWTSLCSNKRSAYINAMKEVDCAIELAPESSEVLGFAGCALSDLGHPERGIPVIERSIQLNPANAQAHAALGTANIMSGNIGQGIKQLEHAVQISSAFPGLAPWATVLSVTSSSTGNPENGLEWGNRAMQSDPRYFGAHLALALAYTQLHEGRKARRSLAEARRLAPDLSERAIEKLIGEDNWERIVTAGVSEVLAA